MTSSSNLVNKCFFRQDGSFCLEGQLHQTGHAVGSNEVLTLPVKIEGWIINCPVCEGKGMILTDRGKDLLLFLSVFGRPLLRDLVDEIVQEREQD